MNDGGAQVRGGQAAFAVDKSGQLSVIEGHDDRRERCEDVAIGMEEDRCEKGVEGADSVLAKLLAKYNRDFICDDEVDTILRATYIRQKDTTILL